MRNTVRHRLGHSLVVIAAVGFFTGCADEAPLGPGPRPAPSAQLATPQAAVQAGAAAQTAASRNDNRVADLGPCDSLQVPTGHKLAFAVYAKGVQIYHWNGTSWSFDGPSAVLTADAAGNGIVGFHYFGPTWESVSGGKLVGTVLKRCTPNPNAIPWLLLAAVPTEGPGIFHRVVFIQRVNTVGGNAPVQQGNAIGEVARVPYTTEYLFYRAQ